MNLMWKLLLAVLVIGVLLPFTLLKDDTGGTLLDFSNLKLPEWRKATKILPKAVKPVDTGSETSDTIYQWIDADGNLQFSNTSPPEGVEFSVKKYDPNLNIIQSVDAKTDDAGQAPEDASEQETTPTEEVGSPYSVEGIKKLFEDVKNVENLLNQRFQKQDEALDQ